MSTTTAARLLDPLAEEAGQEAIAVTATAPRTERIAPEVTGLPGADAVAILRAAGLIAAIESVTSELAPGTVIDQDPTPGAPLGRDAVVTLALAAAPAVDEITESVDDPDPTAELEALDDTERWFAALAVSDNDGIPTRRRRKHRHASVSLREQRVAPPPSRSAPESDLAAGRPDAAAHGALAASLTAVGAFAVSLASYASPWRRSVALAACLLFLTILGLRLFTSQARRSQTLPPRSFARAGAFTLSAQTPAVDPPTRRAPSQPRPQPPPTYPRAVQRRSHRARARVARATDVAPVPSPTTRSVPVAVRSASAPAASQFAYLGQ